METGELKMLLALEPAWTVSVNGKEFLSLPSSDVELSGDSIRLGRFSRRIAEVEWLRLNVFRIRATSRFRTAPDVLTFYPGDRLPPLMDTRRKRRAFQSELAQALKEHFRTSTIERQALFSDKRNGIGGAYPRFLAGARAAISVEPDESSAVVNSVMRAAVMWSASRETARKRISVILPEQRRGTTVARLKALPRLRSTFDWLQWNGERISPLNFETGEPETHVQKYAPPRVEAEVARICALAPDLLQPFPSIAQNAVSIRLRGIEIASVTERETRYPLGTPLDPFIRELAEKRRYGSRHPLARAHEERWLESNLMVEMTKVLPSAERNPIYPQVPSFIGEDRNIVDLLTVTDRGRLAVIEVKASADPDLPFQALDYWLAVERHRKAADFSAAGYFEGTAIRDQPALLILVAPLLAFHKTFDRIAAFFPENLPMMQVGIDGRWKRKINILRRKGLLG